MPLDREKYELLRRRKKFPPASASKLAGGRGRKPSATKSSPTTSEEYNRARRATSKGVTPSVPFTRSTGARTPSGGFPSRKSNPGRRVGRNPTPGVPRRVGSINRNVGDNQEDRRKKVKEILNLDDPRRVALLQRLAKSRNK